MLRIEQDAWKKICAYVDNVDGEISGLGKLKVVDDTFIVSDVAIFKQTVSSAHSDIETKALAEFQVEMVKKSESMKEWVLWWHSHGDMSVFFSGTDTDTIEKSTEFPFLVSLVTNKKHELKARLDIYKPIPMMMDLEVEIIDDEVNPFTEICKLEIAQKVSKPAPREYASQGAGFKYEPVNFREEGKASKYWSKKMRMIDQLDTLYTAGRYEQAEKLEIELQAHIERGVQAGYEYEQTIDDRPTFFPPTHTPRES